MRPVFHADFKEYFVKDKESTVLSVQISQNTPHNHTACDVVIDCRYARTDPEHSDGWTQLDTELGKISKLLQHSQFTLGFHSREDMTGFAETVLEKKMPSISRHATVRYSMHEEHEDKIGHRFPEEDRWYRAALNSQELTGMISVVLYI